ncbi:MAG: hypothetical protein IJA58_07245 [Lachnospiraceae bacterium]|nr:hypothetical protein [Lachnospiraceae bacterium]
MEKRINWLAVVLIICLLTACGKKQEVKLPALSDSLKQEIEEAQRKLYGDSEIVWFDESDESTWANGVRYYGKWGETEVIYFGSMLMYSLDGVDVDFGLTFYWNGKLYSCMEINETGAITADELKGLMDFHKEYYLSTDKRASVFMYEGISDVTVLPAKLQKEVEDVWREKENCELRWTFENSSVRYYGNFDGTVVIYQRSNSIVGVSYDIGFAGVTVGHGSFSLHAYRDGEIVSAHEAYEKGWLTKEDARTVRLYHLLYEQKR